VDRLHLAVFNTFGREVLLRGTSSAAVENAFRGIGAGGGTSYGEGVRALANRKPNQDEDTLFIFIGDEGEYRPDSLVQAVQQSGLNPMAFGLLKVPGYEGEIVRGSARILGIPCFMIEEAMFNDPYSVTRTLRNLIANTPVGINKPMGVKVNRKSLVEQIFDCPILDKPVWA
jgi:hypothetical protein